MPYVSNMRWSWAVRIGILILFFFLLLMAINKGSSDIIVFQNVYEVCSYTKMTDFLPGRLRFLTESSCSFPSLPFVLSDGITQEGKMEKGIIKEKKDKIYFRIKKLKRPEYRTLCLRAGCWLNLRDFSFYGIWIIYH